MAKCINCVNLHQIVETNKADGKNKSIVHLNGDLISYHCSAKDCCLNQNKELASERTCRDFADKVGFWHGYHQDTERIQDFHGFC